MLTKKQKKIAKFAKPSRIQLPEATVTTGASLESKEWIVTVKFSSKYPITQGLLEQAALRGLVGHDFGVPGIATVTAAPASAGVPATVAVVAMPTTEQRKEQAEADEGVLTVLARRFSVAARLTADQKAAVDALDTDDRRAAMPRHNFEEP